MKFKPYIYLLLTFFLFITSCTSGSTSSYTESFPTETMLSKPDVNYTLINMEKGSNATPLKCILDIRLPNRISEDEIKQIAEYIYQNEGADCSPLYIYYFLPDEEPGIDGA